MVTKTFQHCNEAQSSQIATQLAQITSPPAVFYLQGPLGAGKTTFTRSFVRALGHNGNVKSPTYTLVEPYQLGDLQLYHFDLYRLGDPEELEYMGIRDYFTDQSIALIEWPSQGEGLIPPADFIIELSYQDELRKIVITACNQLAETQLTKID